MPSPFDHHAPYQRVMTQAVLPQDRQWLRLLDEMLGGLTLEKLVMAGLSREEARALQGLLAMAPRYEAT